MNAHKQESVMNWNSLFDQLGKCTAKRLFTSDEDQEYFQTSLLCENEIAFSPTTLYFSDWKTFMQTSPKEKISVILFSEEGVDIRTVLKNTYNSAVFYSSDEYRAFYQKCEEIIEEEHRMEQCMYGLSEALFRNEDLFSLADRISDIFEHPVNIVDTTYSVIAFSTHYQFDIEDLKNDDFRIGGYIPPEIIQTLNLYTADTPVYDKTILIRHSEGEFKHFRTPVFMNNICVAYYSVYYLNDEEPSLTGIRYLTKISRIISMAMQIRDYNSLNKDNYYNSLFASLLSGSDISDRDWESRIRAYGYNLKKYRYIFVADITGAGSNPAKTKEASITLHHIIHNSIYAIMNGQIILFASFDGNDDLLEGIIEKCSMLAENHDELKIGISSRFTDLKDITICVREARDAINIGPLVTRNSGVFRYDRCRLHNIAYALSTSEDLDRFFVHELRDLLEYDREHDSELLYTLFVVLTNPKGIAEACKKLHIHRNTLYFRLSKITDITGISYEDPAVSAAILFSFIIMKINGTIDYSREEY